MAAELEGSEVAAFTYFTFLPGNTDSRRRRTVHGRGVRQRAAEENLRRKEGASVDQLDLRVSYEKAGREVAAV
jgi:hypothetical protein